MSDCRLCRFAKWDDEEYSNCLDKQWFVDGCIKDNDDPDGGECEDFEEIPFFDEDAYDG